MSHTTTHQGGVRRLRALSAVLLVTGFGLLAGQGAYAAAPPAGTSINNQATLSYKDGTGAQQLTTSNTVTTTVTQVGAYTLTPTPGNTKSAAAGATVYMPYVLTNTGNGSDSFTINASEAVGEADFSKIEIYEDNGAGLPSTTTPLCTQTTAGSTCSITKTVAASQSFQFVVAYSVPSTATPGAWKTTAVPAGGNQGAIKVTPASGTAWLSTYSQSASDKSESRTDTVNLTTGPVFEVTHSIAAPATGINPVSGTWPTASSGPRNTKTTYTITYSNRGAMAGNLYLKDVLPAGFTYLAGQTVISCASGVALSEAAGGDGAVCTSIPGLEFEQSGQTLQAVIPNVGTATSGTLSFQVQVTNTAQIGSSQTKNVVDFTSTGCSSATIALCASATLSSSNEAAFTVTATYGARFDLQDTTPGTPLNAADGVTSATIVPGGFVRQTHTIQNTGNDKDTFNLSDDFSAVGNYVLRWFQADGVTALLNTDGDANNQVDTGEMQPGETKTFVLQITAPSSVAVGATNLGGTLTATSSKSAANVGNLSPARDAAFAKIALVVGGYVDLTNSASGSATAGDIGPGPGATAVFTTPPSVAGGIPGAFYAEIPLYLKNNDSIANTYKFEASSSNSFPNLSLPTGWSVKFVASASGCMSASSITDLAVAPNAQGTALACVSIPANWPTSTQSVYIKVTSTAPASNGATVSDIIYDAVSVLAASTYRMELQAASTLNAVRGGMVDLPHALNNTGTNSCGATALKVSVDLLPGSTASTTGWNTAIYLDVNGNSVVDAGDTLVTNNVLKTGGLPAGQSLKFLVRVFVPAGANIGEFGKYFVSVIDADSSGNILSTPNGCGGVSVEDQVTVVTGTLTVLKKQAKSAGACPASYPGTLSSDLTTANQQAAPGDCLYYEVVATNNGAAPVNDVSIADAAPTYTTLKTTPAAECSATGLTSGSVSPATNGNTVTCGGSGTALAPGGALTLRFATQINN
ncbi:MAG: hypothetical protein ACKOWC_08950 [Limnohabitans sp.]